MAHTTLSFTGMHSTRNVKHHKKEKLLQNVTNNKNTNLKHTLKTIKNI